MKRLWISILFILCSQIAQAATYYVNQSGSGDADGSSYANSMSVETHNEATFAGDDIIYLCDTITSQVTPPSSGTEGHPIVYRGDYADHAGVVDRQSSYLYGIFSTGNAYITFDGIDVKNCNSDGYFLRGLTDSEPDRDLYITVQNCDITNIGNGTTSGDGIDARGVGLTLYNLNINHITYDGVYHVGADTTISYCTIDHVDETTGTAGGDCIQLGCTAGAWVHHNTLDHSSKGTKHCFLGTNGVATAGDPMIFEYNTCIGLGIDTYSNRAASFEDGTNGQTVRYNIFRDAYNLITPLGPADIYGNIFEGGLHWAINIQGSTPVGSTLNLYGNAFYNNGRTGSEGAIIVPDVNLTVNVSNDTIHTAPYGVFRSGTGSTVNVDYNNPFNIATATYQNCSGGANDVTGDPRFYNPALHDFRVHSDGAGVEKGTDLGSTYQRDYYGHWQGDNGAAWDIGTIWFDHKPTIQ